MNKTIFEIAVIWNTDGTKKCMIKRNIHLDDFIKLCLDEDVSSIYIEKKVEIIENG